MNAAQRLRLEAIASGNRFAPQPTAEDIRILLEENESLEYALECALWSAAGEAFRRTVARRLS